MRLFIILAFCIGTSAMAEELLDNPPTTDRDPAMTVNTVSAVKRTYPGGADEEDLQVQTQLPEATLKTDARSVQRGVFKTLYNQEMKEERQETEE